MPTTVVKTIGLGTGNGYDFSGAGAIQNWINSLSGLNLVALDEIQQGQCHFNGTGDGEFTAAGPVADFNGLAITTDTTRYIELTCAAGQSAFDNAGVRSNPLFYDATKGVALRNTGGAGAAIHGAGSSVHFTGLQVKSDAGAGNTLLLNATDPYTINRCLFQGAECDFGNTDATLITNSVFITTIVVFTRAQVLDGAGPFTFDFCDFIVPVGTSVTNMFDYATASGVATFNSCAFFGASTALSTRDGSATIVYQTGATDLGSPPSGVTGSLVYANQFQSSTNDFRAADGGFLPNHGTTVGGITTDISGFTRSASTPTIGAWEVSGAVHRITTLGAGFVLPRAGLLLPGALAYGAKRLIDNPTLSRRGFIKGWRPDR